MTKKPNLLDTFSLVLWMGAGATLLLLLGKKKTPIATVEGLPPYQGPVISAPTTKAF